MFGSSKDSGEAGTPDSVALPGQALRCSRMLARATVLLDQVRRILDAGVEAVLAGRRRPKGNSEYPAVRIKTLLEPRRYTTLSLLIRLPGESLRIHRPRFPIIGPGV